jgi:ribosomal protein L11 methyltransferase
MNESWTEVTLYSESLTGDEILALIYDLPFDSFDTQDYSIKAYIRTQLLTKDVLNELGYVSMDFPVTFAYKEMPHVNWNEAWETQFNPVHIPGICTIYAEFHSDVPQEEVMICITPKMAFGTGHHGTTSGMLKIMAELNLSGKDILDFGSGTGILAIYASKKMAKFIKAIDIEMPAYESIRENSDLNHCNNIEAILGDKATIPNLDYDIILANVTRNVIVDAMPELCKNLKPEGQIVFSGFFYDELSKIESEANKFNLTIVKHLIENGWCIALFKKH